MPVAFLVVQEFGITSTALPWGPFLSCPDLPWRLTWRLTWPLFPSPLLAGGLWKAVREAHGIGARSFALFLASQRTWNRKPLSDEDADRFREAMQVGSGLQTYSGVRVDSAGVGRPTQPANRTAVWSEDRQQFSTARLSNYRWKAVSLWHIFHYATWMSFRIHFIESPVCRFLIELPCISAL